MNEIQQDTLTTQDLLARQAIRHLLDGNSPNGTQPAECGEWGEVVELLLGAYAESDTPGVKAVWKAVTKSNPDLIRLVSGGGPETQKTPSTIPELSEAAKLPEGLGADACPWLDDYIAFSERWSPRSFEGFHEGTALWILSTVAARRIVVHFGKPRFSNLYVMLGGRTTMHAKSSGTDIGRQTLKACGLDHLLAPDEATPQSFIRALATDDLPPNFDELPPEQQVRARQALAFAGQRGWYYEEFGSGLASMMRADGVMADFRGMLRTFDDCPNDYTRSTIARGTERVERPYLALIANLTPADLRPVAKKGAQLWGDGFLARFTFITPPLNEIRTGRFPRGRRVIPSEITTPLVKWHHRLGIPEVVIQDVEDDDGKTKRQVTVTAAPATMLTMSDDVWEAIYAYHDGVLSIAQQSNEHDLDGNYGRLAEKALRVAVLLASLTNSDTIEICHWARAQEIAERWRLYTHRLYDQVTQLDMTPQAEVEDKILDTLRRWQGTEKYPDGMTANEIGRFVHGLGRAEVKRCADELVAVGVLQTCKPKRALKYYLGPVKDE